MPTVRVGQGELFYAEAQGDGLPVVLIHGAGSDHLVWPPALRRLPGTRVCALDLPGHGRSQGRGRDLMADYAADLIEFLDALTVPRVVLVGHSMGGGIAQLVALSAPGRVAGLVLIGTGARLRVAPAVLEGLRQDAAGTVEPLMGWLWGLGVESTLVHQAQQVMLATDPEVLLGDFLACDGFDARAQVAGIRAPTLVLVGSEDRMTPPRFSQWLAEQLPAAKLVLMEGAGHMLMLERPHQVRDAVSAFLRDVS